MSYNSTLAVQITKNGIAKIIGPLLVDKNILIRTSSASTLRYLADNGKMEAHINLLNDDIMSPLCTLLKQVSLKINFFFILFCDKLVIWTQFIVLYRLATKRS